YNATAGAVVRLPFVTLHFGVRGQIPFSAARGGWIDPPHAEGVDGASPAHRFGLAAAGASARGAARQRERRQDHERLDPQPTRRGRRPLPHPSRPVGLSAASHTSTSPHYRMWAWTPSAAEPSCSALSPFGGLVAAPRPERIGPQLVPRLWPRLPGAARRDHRSHRLGTWPRLATEHDGRSGARDCT